MRSSLRPAVVLLGCARCAHVRQDPTLSKPRLTLAPCSPRVCCVRACRSVQSAAHQGCQSAAITAAGFLRDWLGPRIWAGRLSPEQQALMRQFVPTVVRNNKACYVAEYAKPGFSGGTPGLAH